MLTLEVHINAQGIRARNRVVRKINSLIEGIVRAIAISLGTGFRIRPAPVVGESVHLLTGGIDACRFEHFVSETYIVTERNIPDTEIRSVHDKPAVRPVSFDTGNVTATDRGSVKSFTGILFRPPAVLHLFYQVEYAIEIGGTVEVANQQRVTVRSRTDDGEIPVTHLEIIHDTIDEFGERTTGDDTVIVVAAIGDNAITILVQQFDAADGGAAGDDR